MPPIPHLRPHEVIRACEKFGWDVARQKRSHIILAKHGHIATLSIPDHAQVARGTLRSVVAKSGLTIEEFINAAQ